MTTQTPDPEQTAATEPTPPQAKAKIPPMRWGKTPALEDTTPGSSPDAATDDGVDARPGYPQMSAPEPETPSTKSGSSRESSRAKTDLAQTLKEAIATGFDGGATLAHELLANDEFKRHVGLYLADEQDVAKVSEPASTIIARRAGDLEGATSPDVVDGIALGIAVLGYIVKQFKRFIVARQLRRDGAAVPGLQPNLEETQ